MNKDTKKEVGKTPPDNLVEDYSEMDLPEPIFDFDGETEAEQYANEFWREWNRKEGETENDR